MYFEIKNQKNNNLNYLNIRLKIFANYNNF